MLLHKDVFRQLFILPMICLLAACVSKPPTSTHIIEMQKARFGHQTVAVGDELYLLGGDNASGLLDEIEVYNTRSGEHRILESSPLPRRYLAAVYDGDNAIYLLGGHGKTKQGKHTGKQLEKLDVKTGEISQLMSIPVGLPYSSAVYYRGEILLFGGLLYQGKTEQAVPLAIAIDPVKRSWRALAQMPQALSTKAVLYQDKVYLVGGYNGREGVPSFRRFDPLTEQYELLPSLPSGISAHTALVYQDAIWVFGDYKKQDQVLRFDFKRLKWQQMPVAMQKARHTAGAVIGDSVYITGGNTGGNGPFLNRIQRFQLSAN